LLFFMRLHGPILLAAAFWSMTAPAQTDVPRLSLETYPAEARAAIARAHALATARPEDGDAVGGLARVLQAWEQWDAAHQAYARAQALAPRAFDWPYLDAIVLQRLARPDEAVAQLTAALAVSPDYLPARLKLAEARLDAGDLAESARLFAALTDPACQPAVQFGLGRIAAAEGRRDEAIERFQRAIALFPEYAAAHYALALAYRSAGRTDDARAELAEHARYGSRWPGLPDPVLARVTALREDAGALLQKGIKLADAGDVDGAIEAHEAALARDPSLTQAHANLISLYARAHNFAKVEEHYRATAAAGSAADAEYDYGVALAMQEKWDAAADAYRRAIAANPLHANAHNNLGQIFERGRQVDAALAEYQRAVAAQPTLRLARFNEARMLMGLGRSAEAIPELERIVDPRDAEAPRYLFALSAAHLRAGHRDEARTWAAAARDLAVKYGDTALAAAIDRDLASIK
jgi:tetratricopeptide (TPR) repeat protein